MRRIMMGLLAALLLAPVGSAQGAYEEIREGIDEGFPDLNITSFWMDDMFGPRRVAGVVESTVIHVNVTNEGPLPAGFFIVFRWDPEGSIGGLEYINGDLESSSELYEAPLFEHDVQEVSIQWTPTERQDGPGALNIQVQALGIDGDERNNQVKHPMHINSHDLNLSVESLNQEIGPDETVFLRYTITNNGNVPEPVVLDLLDGNPAPDRLEGFLSQTEYEVPAKTAIEGTLFVTYPWAGVDTPFTARFDIAMESQIFPVMTAQSGLFESSASQDSIGYSFNVTRIPADEGTLYGPVDGIVDAAFLVKNDGVRDTYRVEAMSPWNATVSWTLVGLLPGESIPLHVNLEVPQGVPGELAENQLKVISGHGSDPLSLHFFDSRIAGPAIQVLDVSPLNSAIYKGENITVEVELSNQGNQPSSQEGQLIFDIAQQGLHFTKSVDEAIAEGETKTVTVSIGPLQTPGPFELDVAWKETPTTAPFDNGFYAGFVHAPSIQLLAPDALGGTPGEEVHYTSINHAFNLSNTGNAVEAFTVQVVAEDGNAGLVNSPQIALEPGQSRSIPVHHVIPAGKAGNDTLTLTVGISGKPDWTWSASVDTHILPPPAPHVSLPNALPEAWLISEPLSLAVRVDSSTNVTDVVAIIQDPQGMNTTVPMALNGTDYSATHVFPEAGAHTLRFQATDMFNSVTKTDGVVVPVNPGDPPTLSWDVPVDGTPIHINDSIAVSISDPSIVASLNLTVKNGTGAIIRDESLEFDVQEGSASFNLTGSGPGQFHLTIQATDVFGQSSELDASVEFIGDPKAKGNSDPSADSDPTHEAPLPAWWVTVFGILFASGARRKVQRNRGGQAMTASGQVMTTNGFHKRPFKPLMNRWFWGKQWSSSLGRKGPRRGASIVILLVIVSMVMGGVGGAVLLSNNEETDSIGQSLQADTSSIDQSLPGGISDFESLPLALQEALQGDIQMPVAPDTIAGLIDEMPLEPFERIPIPAAPAGDDPIMAALHEYTTLFGLEDPGLDAVSQIQSLQLAPEAEEALARLILSFVEATRIQNDAVANLTQDELAFVTGDMEVINAWSSTLGDVPFTAAFDGRVAEIAAKVDLAKNLQAADLLARAAEELRHPLAMPPLEGGPMSSVQDVLEGEKVDAWDWAGALLGRVGPVTSTAPSSNGLDEAILGLASTYGLDLVPEAVAIEGIPADVEDALAAIIMAHGMGAYTDAPTQAANVLEATESALPVLQAWSDQLARGAIPPPVPLTQSMSAASPTFNSYDCAPTDDPNPGDFIPSLQLPDVDGIDPFGVIVHIPIPGFGADCKPNPGLLTITGPGDTAFEQDTSIIHIDLGGDDIYNGTVAGSGNVTMAFNVNGVIENSKPYREIGSFFLELSGDDEYRTPELDQTQGFAREGASLLVDVAGADTYEAGESSQGVSCCTRVGSDETTFGGVGMLFDREGNDIYIAGEQSQGYAATGLLAPINATSLTAPQSNGNREGEDAELGLGGFLLDAAGNDHYEYATQAVADSNRDARSQPAATGAQLYDALVAPGAFSKAVAGFIDVSGDDSYHSTVFGVNTEDATDILANQAVARADPNLITIPSTASAVWLDLGGNDAHTMRQLDSMGGQQVPVEFNGASKTSTRSNGKEVELLRDIDLNYDSDNDGASDQAEEAFGTDSNDPSSHPGLNYGENSGVGVDDAFIVRAPALAEGLVIGGRGPTQHVDSAIFVVDLGGNDSYQAPNNGGVPVDPQLSDNGGGGVGNPRIRAPTVFLLDVGAGNDVYVNQNVAKLLGGQECFVNAGCNPIVFGFAQGGASAGVAVLADSGGSNRFESDLQLDLEVTQTGDQDAKAVSTVIGVTQGAGYAAGVGLLLAWDGMNTFNATTASIAAEYGGPRPHLPVAASHTVAQGGAWQRGVGILASFGNGSDTYRTVTSAITPFHDGNFPGDEGGGAIAFSVSQGAGHGANGLLLDKGGDNRFIANAPIAQGAAIGFESIDQDLEAVGSEIRNVPTGGGMNFRPPSSGLLWSGSGDDVMIGTSVSQASAMAKIPHEETDDSGWLVQKNDGWDANSIPTNEKTISYGRAPFATGILLDEGGNDVRQLVAPDMRIPPAMAQGFAGFHGIAVLLDGAGDDVNDAEGFHHVQGVGVFGQAALVDLSGHDMYSAKSQSQGFASDDVTVAVSMQECVGQAVNRILFWQYLECTRHGFPVGPASKNEPVSHPDNGYEYGSYQVQGVITDMPPSVGLLVERAGHDRYIAEAESQGAARDDPRTFAKVQWCHPDRIVHQAFTIGPPSEYPFFSAISPCSHERYPDYQRDDVEDARKFDWDEARDVGPRGGTAVLGLLFDLEGNDRYQYPQSEFKTPLSESATSDNANDWVWNQTFSGGANLNDTALPENIFRDGDRGRQITREPRADEDDLRFSMGFVDEEEIESDVPVFAHVVRENWGEDGWEIILGQQLVFEAMRNQLEAQIADEVTNQGVPQAAPLVPDLPWIRPVAPFADFYVEPITLDVQQGGVVSASFGKVYLAGSDGVGFEVTDGYGVKTPGVDVPGGTSVPGVDQHIVGPADNRVFDHVKSGSVMLDLGGMTLDPYHVAFMDIGVNVTEWTVAVCERAPASPDPAPECQDPVVDDGQSEPHILPLEEEGSIEMIVPLVLPHSNDPTGTGRLTFPSSISDLDFLPSLRIEVFNISHDGAQGVATLWPLAVNADLEPMDDASRHLPGAAYDEFLPVHGIGVDSNTLTNATNMLLYALVPDTMESITDDPDSTPVQIALDVFRDDGSPLASGESAAPGNGWLTMQATIRQPSQNDQNIQRVTFQANNEVIGYGELVSATEEEAVYQFVWKTNTTLSDTELQYPDRDYDLVTSAFLSATGADSSVRLDSVETNIVVNNPPLVSVQIAKTKSVPSASHAFSPAANSARLFVDVSEDGAFPIFPPEDSREFDDDEAPGGFVTVTAEGPEPHVVFDDYVPAGRTPIDVDGMCPSMGQPYDHYCRDGLYELNVTVTDSFEQVSSAELEVLYDGTGPKSWIDMPAYANADEHSAGGQNLLVFWGFTDDVDGTTGNVSDTEEVQIYSLKNGEFNGRVDQGTAGTSTISGIAQGDVYEFVSVAVDRLGNLETPCLETESFPPGVNTMCFKSKLTDSELPLKYRSKTVEIDFIAPEIQWLDATPVNIVPGVTPIEISASITDDGSGLQAPIVLFEDGNAFPMVNRPVGSDFWVLDDWHLNNTHLANGREQQFAFQILAEDLAGNQLESPAKLLFVDDHEPATSLPSVGYIFDNVAYDAARSGGTVQVRLDVVDGGLDFANAVVADWSQMTGQSDARACALDSFSPAPDDFLCQYKVPSYVESGTYRVPLDVTDKAGNRVFLEVEVEILNEKLRPGMPWISDVSHDGATVSWTTDSNGTSQLYVARSSENILTKGMTTVLDSEYKTNHSVRVTGLIPSTQYFVLGESRNPGGVPNATEVLSFRTTTAIDVSFPESTEGQVLTSDSVSFHVSFLPGSGNDPADVDLFIQDSEAKASPIHLASFDKASGSHSFQLNRSDFADGAYKLVVEAQRVADFSVTRSPAFIIDNTAPVLIPHSPLPGRAVANSNPVVEWLMLDPLAHDLPSLQSLQVAVDGIPLTQSGGLSNVAYEFHESLDGDVLTDRATLRIPVLRDLADGQHNMSIHLSDHAGNQGHAELPFRVDTSGGNIANAAGVQYQPGPAAAKPGGTVGFSVIIEDESGIKNAWLEHAPWAIQAEMIQAGDAWKGVIAVPDNASSGIHSIEVVTRDGLENQGRAGTVDVLVDADEPILESDSGSVDKSTVALHVQANERVMATVTSDGKSWTNSGYFFDQNISVGPLTPDADAMINITLTDMAGNELAFTRYFTTAPDTEPPTAVSDLEAILQEDGAVRLEWSAANDDSGVANYTVLRTAQGIDSISWSLEGAARSFNDTSPPRGRDITYQVVAVDVAGKVGAAKSVDAFIAADPPRLTNVHATPERGDANTVFTFNVTYFHEFPAVRMGLYLDGQYVPMFLRSANQTSCLQGCLYVAEARLGVTTLEMATSKVRIESEAPGHEVSLEFDRPLVWESALLADSGESNEAPTLSAPILVLMLTLLIFVRRRNSS